uniref:SKP1-like protein 1B n=1 Tax=Erigeron canadensis TaxID=72917 RepID=UPI001CB9D5EA|nr:SKP1-like protein 1B [Erigeron canadensis]
MASAMEAKSLEFYAEFRLKIEHPNHILGQVLSFLEKIREIKETGNDEELKEFYSDFLSQNQKQGCLYGLLDAAYDLRIKSLWELMSKVVADMVTGKTNKEISKIFKLENDITPEEMGHRRNEVWEFK